MFIYVSVIIFFCSEKIQFNLKHAYAAELNIHQHIRHSTYI